MCPPQTIDKVKEGKVKGKSLTEHNVMIIYGGVDV
jgi:hypothetical protein